MSGGRMPEEAYRLVGLERNVARLRPVDAVDAVDAAPVELPAAVEFPVGAMPRPCRRLIEEAAAAIVCPPEFVAAPMLAVLGSAIGNSRVLKLKSGWEESATIYAAVVAEPGEKKSPALNVALAPVYRTQAALREKHRLAVDEHKREVREWEVERKDNAKNGLPSPPEPERPRMERTLVEDTTVEALGVLLEENPRGVLATRDELSGWVRSMDQYKQGGKGADRQFYLSAWSSSHVAVDRKSREEPLIIQRPFVGVFGAIQPGVLPELGSGREDGLLDRFAFAYPDVMPSRWSEDEISDEAKDGYARLYGALRERHMPTDEYGDPDPTRIHFAPDAKSVLVEAINAHREEMEQPGFPNRLKGPWSKLEAYLARFCLILAMTRAADERAAERVEARDVLSAVVLLDYFKTMARRVYVGLHGENPADKLAADVAEFLRQRGGHFKDEPTVLHKELVSDAKPARADELSKSLKAIAARSPILEFDAGNFKKDGQSRRFVELSLRNGVNGVNGVNREKGEKPDSGGGAA
jgi:putative DNA primase/helicase